MGTPGKESIVTGRTAPRAPSHKKHSNYPPRPVTQTHPFKTPYRAPRRRHDAYFPLIPYRRQRRQVPKMRFGTVFWLPSRGYRGSTTPDLHRTCQSQSEGHKHHELSPKDLTRQGGTSFHRLSPMFLQAVRPDPLQHGLTAAHKAPKSPQPVPQRCGYIPPRPADFLPLRPRSAWGD